MVVLDEQTAYWSSPFFLDEFDKDRSRIHRNGGISSWAKYPIFGEKSRSSSRCSIPADKLEFCPLVNTRKKLGFAPPSQNVKPEIGWQTWGSWERGAGQDSTPFRDRTVMGKLLWIAMIWAFRWERGIWFIAFPILNSRYDRAMNRFLFELVFLWDLPRKNL